MKRVIGVGAVSLAVLAAFGCGSVEQALPQEAQDTIQQAREVKQSGQQVLDAKKESDKFAAEIQRTKATSPEARAFIVKSINDPNPAIQLLGLSLVRTAIQHDRTVGTWARAEVQKHIDQLKAQGSQEIAVWTEVLRQIPNTVTDAVQPP